MRKTDIDKLIEIILSDEKLNTSHSGVYRDTPILRPASQMENYLPPACAKMREIAREPGIFDRPAEVFLRQAELMKDYEDDFVFSGHFLKYFPTYQAMNDAQLRGYFSWRTRLRRGETAPAPLSFIFVHLYELLSLVGVSTPQEGFDALNDVWNRYRDVFPQLDSYLPDWLTEFAAYYGLDPALVKHFSEADFYAHYNTLAALSAGEEEIFDSLTALSAYPVSRSRLFKAEPELFRSVCVSFFRELSAYSEKKRIHPLCRTLFGKVTEERIRIFSAAVFLDRRQYEDYVYRVNEVVCYRCCRGAWFRTAIHGEKKKSRELGVLMKAADQALRTALGFTPAMKPVTLPKYSAALLETVIDAALEQKKKREAPVVTIDLSKLAGIRSSADLTRDRLITGEEDGEEENEAFAAPPAPPAPIPPVQKEEPAAPPAPLPSPPASAGPVSGLPPLSGAETAVLLALLCGGNAAAAAKEHGVMLSVAVDSVNEKLFDLFGDTAIGFDGDSPFLIEDYEEELKGMICP